MSEEEIKEHLLRKASEAHSLSVFIYNKISDVGHGKLTADNALHQLVEIEHRAKTLGDDILGIAHQIKQNGGAK